MYNSLKGKLMKKTLLVLAVSIVMALGCASTACANDQVGDQKLAAASASVQADDGEGASDQAGEGKAADGENTGEDAGKTPDSEQADALASIESATVTAPKQTYTGAALEPDITVELDDETLKPDVDYTVTYTDNKEVGTGKVTITGIGKYEGEATGEFAIDHVPELDAFTDLDSNGWYLSSANGTLPDAQTYYLDVVLARGIMLGYEDSTGARTKFGPDDPVTRGQVATMLYRLSHPDATDTTDAKAISHVGNESGLPDVARGKYYTAAVNWAVEAGVVSGYRDSVDRYFAFGADDPISREQLATMIGRFCVGYLTMKAGSASLGGFSDYQDISSFAKEGVRFCLDNSIMSGYSGTSLFGPGDQATRCQVAKVMAMLVTLTDADENIAENGWPTECEWHGGKVFPAPEKSNWRYEGGAWHYRNANGKDATGFLEINGNKVHFDDNGKMTTGWFKADGATYHFADNGIAVKGWEIYDGLWHHFDETTAAFTEKTATPNIAIDDYARIIAAYCGYDLRRCYDYMSIYRQVKELDDRLHFGPLSDDIIYEYACMVRDRAVSDCYGDAAMFCLLARQCGYAAGAYGGHCQTISIGPVPHGWTEVFANGTTYVCDYNLMRDAPGSNWFMVTYDEAPIEYYR